MKQLQADSDLPKPDTSIGPRPKRSTELLAATSNFSRQRRADLTAAVQTVLTLTGYWTGPIDGLWSDELTAALQDFQTALGVEPTGEVDTATLAAFQQAIAAGQTPPTPTTEPATEPTAPAATTPATTADPAAGADPTVLVADSDLGQILTAADGMTVYLFTPDAQSAPTCVDSCAETWPPLTIDDASQVTGGDGTDPSLLATLEHPEGTQITYNGWPLYFFAGDTAPGDTNGHGQSDVWYALDPTGNPIGIA